MTNWEDLLRPASEINALVEQAKALKTNAKSLRLAAIDAELKGGVILEQYVLASFTDPSGFYAELTESQDGHDYLASDKGKEFIRIIEQKGYKVSADVDDTKKELWVSLRFAD